MSKRLGTIILAFTMYLSPPIAIANEFAGDTRLPNNSGPTSERTIDLFHGDLGAEIGIGCSNNSGTSGGPNDMAVGPFFLGLTGANVTRLYYHVFTNVSPTLTALSFKVWEGDGLSPGSEIGAFAGLDYSAGEHTAFLGSVTLSSEWFFFGLSQPQTDAALRIGLDTSSGGGTTSFIRAPDCGLDNWGTMTSIGFAGNWVMMATVDEFVGVPIELATWGEVKSRFQAEERRP